jgi:hypothetical protein
MKYEVSVEGETFLIEIEDEKIFVNGQAHAVDMRKRANSRCSSRTEKCTVSR